MQIFRYCSPGGFFEPLMGPVDLHLTSSPNGSDIFVLQNIMLNRDCCIQQGRGEKCV